MSGNREGAVGRTGRALAGVSYWVQEDEIIRTELTWMRCPPDADAMEPAPAVAEGLPAVLPVEPPAVVLPVLVPPDELPVVLPPVELPVVLPPAAPLVVPAPLPLPGMLPPDVEAIMPVTSTW